MLNLGDHSDMPGWPDLDAGLAPVASLLIKHGTASTPRRPGQKQTEAVAAVRLQSCVMRHSRDLRRTAERYSELTRHAGV